MNMVAYDQYNPRNKKMTFSNPTIAKLNNTIKENKINIQQVEDYMKLPFIQRHKISQAIKFIRIYNDPTGFAVKRKDHIFYTYEGGDTSNLFKIAEEHGFKYDGSRTGYLFHKSHYTKVPISGEYDIR